jgi:hypothetical protein
MKLLTIAAVAVALIGLSACAGKKEHSSGYSSSQHSSTGYSK